MSLFLPTSIGEALDKLNILNLKLKKIKDEKRVKFIIDEYNELNKILYTYVENNKFYYNILFKVNEKIWDVQDDLRLNKTPSSNELYKVILDENDRRCRIKNKINSKIGSLLREQKGYPLKKAFVCSHLGLGDMICMIGVVRYLSTIYDEVYVMCKESYLENVKLFYKDDDSIKFIICGNIHLLSFKPGSVSGDMIVYTCGLHSQDDTVKNYINNIPEIFYEQMGVNFEIIKEYFFVDTSDFEKDDLIQEIIKNEYYFVHDTASNLDINLTQNLLHDNVMILNPNRNPYPQDHEYYQINEKIKNKPLAFFIPILQNAKKIYCIDSAFYNLANFVDTSRVNELYVYSRENRRYKLFTKFKYIN